MRYIAFITLFLLLSITTNAQTVFQEEVDLIEKRNDSIWNSTKETIVFTGSSSIRFWKDLQERFPKHHILNTGFGGSQAVDLLYHLDELVLKYKPTKVFIYEGDNDIFSKKKPKDIIATTQEIIKKIKAKNSSTAIVLISAKPSVARWRFRKKYKKLNIALKKLAETDDSLQYANVWNIMLKGRKVRKDIFISDKLHMNAKGYELWYQALKSYVNQ